MATKHELAMQVAAALGRPNDDATIAAYQALPLAELEALAVGPVMPACKLCGEDADAEMGEFWDQDKGESVVAHAQCGLDAGLPMA